MEHGGVRRKRKTNFRFTENQLFKLNKRFRNDPYIKGTEKELMAKNLDVTPSAIKNWFYTKRLRQKQHLASETSNATVHVL